VISVARGAAFGISVKTVLEVVEGMAFDRGYLYAKAHQDEAKPRSHTRLGSRSVIVSHAQYLAGCGEGAVFGSYADRENRSVEDGEDDGW
jgi:hypothetical protein